MDTRVRGLSSPCLCPRFFKKNMSASVSTDLWLSPLKPLWDCLFMSELFQRQSLSPNKKSKKQQEDIIRYLIFEPHIKKQKLINKVPIRFRSFYFRSLAEERDSYFSKLKDIEDELRLIEEQTKNSSLFFGMTSQKFCQRLNKILISESCECHQKCQCHQTCHCQQKCQCQQCH